MALFTALCLVFIPFSVFTKPPISSEPSPLLTVCWGQPARLDTAGCSGVRLLNSYAVIAQNAQVWALEWGLEMPTQPRQRHYKVAIHRGGR